MKVQHYLQRVQQQEPAANALLHHFGMRLELAENGTARISLPCIAGFIQGGGRVAGGILGLLADEAMAHAALSLLRGEQGVVTTEMNIRYIRGAAPQPGVALVGLAHVQHAGKRMMVVEAKVLHGSQELALAGASFMVREDSAKKNRDGGTA